MSAATKREFGSVYDVTTQDREPGEVDLSSFHDCPLCDKLFFSFMDLYDHIARHRKEPK